DCGTRPFTGAIKFLEHNDSLYYTSSYMLNNSSLKREDVGRMSGALQTSWMRGKLPLRRHGGKPTGPNSWDTRDGRINVAFADGHAETVAQHELRKVRISPYRY
ncbi:MAG: hypothetical protein RMJ35_03575, partial [Phycisphaerales bacterium]|nr:hypothetical protein [Phycisphaerales bacterium]